MNKRTFSASVPIIDDESFGSCLAALGAHREPQHHHWTELMKWIALDTHESLPNRLSRALLNAYKNLEQFPFGGIDRSTKCLLDSRGKLHNLDDVELEFFLLDDAPRLRKSVEDSGLPFSFAECGESGAYKFFESANVKCLSKVGEFVGFETGEVKPVADWLNSRVEKVLPKIHSESFGSAISALIDRWGGRDTTSPLEIYERLRSCLAIKFLDRTDRRYNINGHIVQTPEDFCVEEKSISLLVPRSSYDFNNKLSRALAELLIEGTNLQTQLANGIFRIISCDRNEDIKSYLLDQDIAWFPPTSEPDYDVIGDILDENEAAPTDGDLGEDSQSIEGEDIQEIEQGNDFSEISGELIGNQIEQLVDHTGRSKTQSIDNQPVPTPIDLGQPVSVAHTKRVFPRLEDVQLQWLEPSGERQSEKGDTSEMRSPPSYRDPVGVINQDGEDEKEIGRKGEELIYREELRRVAEFGLGDPENLVTWVSRDNEFADHDILSIDENGRQKWIEVKSTVGTDGKFTWPHREFRLAVIKNDQYCLVRVYRVGSLNPLAIEYPDPVQEYKNGTLTLDLKDISARVDGV